MDPYNVSLRQFQDNLALSVNYTNMSLDYMMQQMHLNRPDNFLATYPHVPSQEELWRERQGGAGGSGGGGDDYDDEERESFILFLEVDLRNVYFYFVCLFYFVGVVVLDIVIFIWLFNLFPTFKYK